MKSFRSAASSAIRGIKIDAPAQSLGADLLAVCPQSRNTDRLVGVIAVELPLFDREILFTDGLGPAIRLILQYREYPRLNSHCEALLFDLYRRKGEHKMAAITSHKLCMVSLRSLPNMLASRAKQKSWSTKNTFPSQHPKWNIS